MINPFGLRPPFNLTANIIAFLGNGEAFITAVPQFLSGPSYVLKVSPTGVLLNTFPLADNGAPTGIAVGPDGNLWIAETGTNEIAKMTPSGVVTQYAIATPNAQPLFITPGSDGALWFTESGANALGRITTAGAMTEYPVPTPMPVCWESRAC